MIITLLLHRDQIQCRSRLTCCELVTTVYETIMWAAVALSEQANESTEFDNINSDLKKAVYVSVSC
jgi:hypothetical protein